MQMTTRANPTLTPGKLMPGVTVDILSRRGYTKTIRPSRAESFRMKLRVMKLYGISRLQLRQYTLDHLIALENGGHPGSKDDLDNVWPQPKEEALRKDLYENLWHQQILYHELTIGQARDVALDMYLQDLL